MNKKIEVNENIYIEKSLSTIENKNNYMVWLTNGLGQSFNVGIPWETLKQAKWFAKMLKIALEKIKEQVIIIEIKGGIVQDVNTPPGITVVVKDFDIDDDNKKFTESVWRAK